MCEQQWFAACSSRCVCRCRCTGQCCPRIKLIAGVICTSVCRLCTQPAAGLMCLAPPPLGSSQAFANVYVFSQLSAQRFCRISLPARRRAPSAGAIYILHALLHSPPSMYSQACMHATMHEERHAPGISKCMCCIELSCLAAQTQYNGTGQPAPGETWTGFGLTFSGDSCSSDLLAYGQQGLLGQGPAPTYTGSSTVLQGVTPSASSA